MNKLSILLAFCISFMMFSSISFATDLHSNKGSRCWQPAIKQNFPRHFNLALDQVFNDGRRQGMPDAVEEIAYSPRDVAAKSYGVKNIDNATGNFSCSAYVRVVFRSRQYGDIVVPATAVGFEVMQSEDGIHIYLTGDDISDFLYKFTDRLREIGINYNVVMTN